MTDPFLCHKGRRGFVSVGEGIGGLHTHTVPRHRHDFEELWNEFLDHKAISKLIAGTQHSDHTG